jgi:hypothetical protein
MSSSLTDEQSTAVRKWAEEGADLAAIQKRLDEEFEVRLTFMDTRFLIADLGIELVAEEEPEPEPEAEASSAPEQAPLEEPTADTPESTEAPAEEVDVAEADADLGTATATVSISEVQRPGMMISGSVTFDGGEKAEWYLDQMGQLGLDPATPEFRPSPAQMRAFQIELQKAAQQKGF